MSRVPIRSFQQIITQLHTFWAAAGCAIIQPLDAEVGAGTFHPATFLRAVSPEPWSCAYVQPSRRPQDGRYGNNPNRLQHYYQFQVVIKPSPSDFQALFLHSLAQLGISRQDNDVRFVEDDWESPSLGAWGLGWEVWGNGMEIAQFTYFQEVGGVSISPVMGEITYGLERLAMLLQDVDNVMHLHWNENLTYADLHQHDEEEGSSYNFEQADTTLQTQLFNTFEEQGHRLVDQVLPIPAYDMVVKCSHAFNLLDARGVVSVTERAGYIARMRKLAGRVAVCYRAKREHMGFPLQR